MCVCVDVCVDLCAFVVAWQPKFVGILPPTGRKGSSETSDEQKSNTTKSVAHALYHTSRAPQLMSCNYGVHVCGCVYARMHVFVVVK